ncbi:septation protein SpoVG family protein [bacterium]|nr:septation protein SpoVG family protein [bacterium]
MNRNVSIVSVLGFLMLTACGKSEPSAAPAPAVSDAPSAQDQAGPAVDMADEDAPAGNVDMPKTASGLAITEIRKGEGGKYSATLNGAIVFRELTLQNDRLFFPKVPGRGDQSFHIVYLKDRTIADQIKAAIQAGKATAKGAPGELKVTEVKWREFGREGNLKGFANVMFNDAIEIKDCKLLDGKNGLWVAWPSVKKDGEFYDLIFALDEGVRKQVTEAVIKEAGL